MEFYNYGFWIIAKVKKVLKFFAFLGNDISINEVIIYFFILFI